MEVRSAAEIFATLDPDAALEAVPFMPEMLQHVGRRFRVSRRVEKICDTAGGTFSSRRMRRTVFLEDLRCGGAGHGGCQAGCRLYWKEEWLRRVEVDSEQPESNSAGRAELESIARAGTRTRRELDGDEVETYRCQATEAPAASEPLRGFDVRQYLREVACGNVGPIHAAWVLACAAGRNVLRVGRARDLPLRPNETATASPEALGLQPGELVQVRSRTEIAATLDERGKNRGLWFDLEMVPHCGGTYRVHGRVERFIDDRTGRMVELSSDCLILDGVVCSGERSSWRLFCPRAIYPWWREAWLRRVEDETAQPPAQRLGSAGCAEMPGRTLRLRDRHHRRYLRRLLGSGGAAAPERESLALLPSGPDAVRTLPVRGTRSVNAACADPIPTNRPSDGVRPRMERISGSGNR